MEKLVLNRKGNEVYFGEKKLTRVDQATKGTGKEVIKIEGLPNSNGQKWVSLATLVEGENELTCRARDVTITNASRTKVEPGYILNPDEVQKVAGLQAQIDAIIEVAKKRFVPTPKLSTDPSKLTEAERDALIANTLRYIELLKEINAVKGQQK